MSDAERAERDVVAAALREFAGTVLGDSSFEAVLEIAAHVVKRTVSGADEVSVTMRRDEPVTIAATEPLALDVDAGQYDSGDGPCLEAFRLGETIVADDQRTDPRWPHYAARAVRAGVRSSVSVPLPVDDMSVGAFNVYSLTVGAFDDAAVRDTEKLARYAGVILSNASLYFTASSRAEQLAEALQSRAVIEQAKES